MINTIKLSRLIVVILVCVVLISCDDSGGSSGTPGDSGTVDPSVGRLTYLDYYATPGPDGLLADRIRISPDGRHAYVTTDFDDYLLWFDRDSATGALTIGGSWSYSASSDMKDCVISPDGRNVYISAQGANKITWFNRDAATGDLTREGTDEFDGPELVEPTNMAISPDGRNLYVLGYMSNKVVLFSRDTGTGDLTYAGSLADSHVDDSYSIAVSPDNTFVYVSSDGNNSLVWFARSTATGALTYAGQYSGISPRQFIISPDGRHLYAISAISSSEGSVYWFERNIATGELTLAGSFTSYLLWVGCIAASADWKNIYATGNNNPFDYTAVFCFTRNSGTGALKFSQSISGWTIPGDLLEKGADIAVSPDNAHVYTVWRNQTDDRRGMLWFSRSE